MSITSDNDRVQIAFIVVLIKVACFRRGCFVDMIARVAINNIEALLTAAMNAL